MRVRCLRRCFSDRLYEEGREYDLSSTPFVEAHFVQVDEEIPLEEPDDETEPDVETLATKQVKEMGYSELKASARSLEVKTGSIKKGPLRALLQQIEDALESLK